MRRTTRAVATVAVATLALASTPGPCAAAFSATTANSGSTFHATTISPPTSFSASTSCQLTWTATASTWATGYTIERWHSGVLQQTTTVTPATTASYTEHGLVLSTYTWKIWAYKGTWTSTVQQSTATVVLCL
jgi:hypothetical protein